MENILYSITLLIHIVAALLCAAAPFYHLRLVKLRKKSGYPIIYAFDRSMENILTLQDKMCLVFKIALLSTGFGFPLIYYSFHGVWRDVTQIALVVFGAKVVISFLGLLINLYTYFIINADIQKTFAIFRPTKQPSDELLNHFWDFRDRRTKLCRACFALTLVNVVITPILRFYKEVL